jgi:hypothetical protein
VVLDSHQLSGPAADWWDAYVEAHEEPEIINWLEFRAALHAHHVPQGVIKLKKKEFHDLKQGSVSVNKYITKFTQLSRYALHEVNTDEKKHECFLNFQGMVNKALVLENPRVVMERKHKLVRQHQSDSSSRPRVATSSVGPVFCPAQPQF